MFDWRGACVWWGFLDKITINDGVHSFGIALDNMFNRVKATYELLAEGARAPHTLVMTATPIPRTLMLCAYGDMDVSRLTEKPPGRQQIEPASCR